MELTIIKSEKQYKKALQRFEEIFFAAPNTVEGNEAQILALIIEDYENKHYPIDPPDPIEAIKYKMEQLGYKQKDLVDIIGSNGRVSEVLNRKRKLTLEMIRNLHEKLNISLESLVKAY
jgi:HTH-type transcriptional regulator / antitoxin HigA